MSQNKVYIALGTNIGNWENNFHQALFQINKFSIITNFSSIYFSKPYGFKNQKNFCNMAIELETNLSPFDLLKSIKLIEKMMKKNKKIINGPRRIDLDIIFYNRIILNKNSLIIPHPQAHIRDFVLYPISDMNSFFIHPVIKKTIKEVISNLEYKYIFKKLSVRKKVY